MAITYSIIDDIVCGSDKTLDRTIANVPSGTTLTKAWLTVKTNYTRTDAQAIFQKVLTTSAALDGQIFDAGSSGAGFVEFLLLPADTLALTPRRSYLFDMKFKLSNGREYVGETGVLIATPRVTQASS